MSSERAAEVELRQLAYIEESRDFIKSTTPTKQVREWLGIPESGTHLQHTSNNQSWNEISREIRIMMKDIDNIQTLQGQMRVTDEIEKAESLCRYTSEPRKYADWFRMKHVKLRARQIREKPEFIKETEELRQGFPSTAMRDLWSVLEESDSAREGENEDAEEYLTT